MSSTQAEARQIVVPYKDVSDDVTLKALSVSGRETLWRVLKRSAVSAFG
jgi:hypothetical protein